MNKRYPHNRPGDPDPPTMDLNRKKLQLNPPTMYGPAMQKLAPMWRRFVQNYLANGGRNATKCYIEAGFGGHPESCRRAASKMLHDPRIQEAIREETKKMMVGDAPLAQSVVKAILDNPVSSAKDRLTAAKMIWDRTGFIAATEHRTTHEVTLDPEQMRLQVEAFAKELGLDAAKILGSIATPAPLAIEADYEEVDVKLEDLF